MFLTTDKLNPDRESDVKHFDKNLLETLPKDYLQFLQKFGDGTFCSEVYITYPDSQTILSTFKDYTNFWELNEFYNKEDLLQSIQIGSTFDGDINCVTKNKKGQIFVLPRDSETVQSYKTFNDTIKSFVPKISTPYFDPSFDTKSEEINLIKSSGVLLNISPIHEKFLKSFSFDFVIDETTQPKYFFKNFGGWVNFDLFYKNGIYIKFQNQSFEKVSPIINFLKQLAV